MNILSLFDGMGCGRLALDRSGIRVEKYFASEIDKYAMNIAKKNFPDIIHIGDVQKINTGTLPGIDLLLGGSPCQGFSVAGKGLNFSDPRSKLFFEYVRIYRELKKVNPDLNFLLENVKMKKEFQDIISEKMGVEPIEINSALVSAQNRKRLYWTNISGIEQPEDKGILLKDILESGESLRGQLYGARIIDRAKDENGKRIDHLGSVAGKTVQEIEINKNPDKTNCLSTVQKDNVLIPVIKNRDRYISKPDKSQCLDANYHKGPDNHGQRTIIALDTKNWRKLSPLECERLQTLPDNYTAGVSNTQRYRMIGNGWTVDVIAHILSFLKPLALI